MSSTEAERGVYTKRLESTVGGALCGGSLRHHGLPSLGRFTQGPPRANRRAGRWRELPPRLDCRVGALLADSVISKRGHKRSCTATSR